MNPEQAGYVIIGEGALFYIHRFLRDSMFWDGYVLDGDVESERVGDVSGYFTIASAAADLARVAAERGE